MRVEIEPEPTPEERAAIVAALSDLVAAPADGPGAWWRAGVREAAGLAATDGSGASGGSAEQPGRDPHVVEP